MAEAKRRLDSDAPGDWPLDDLLTAIGEAAYVWDVASDRLQWTSGAREVLGLSATAAIETASGYAAAIDPDALTTRREAVFGADRLDRGEGVAFEIEYPLSSGPRGQRLWVQDRGRWTAGQDGQPVTVIGVVRRLGARYESAEQAAMLSRFDPLTGQLARARLIEVAGAALASAQRLQGSCALVLASITNLGAINESYGYDVGDFVIVETSRRLKGAMRGADALGRFSTSTFGIVLQDCDRSDLDVALRRLAGAMHDAPAVTPVGPVAVRIAVGAVVAPRHARDIVEMTARAREALRHAAATAAAVSIYAPDPEREAKRRANMRRADELIGALNDRRVRLALQPVFRSGSRVPVWSEALVRVVKEDGGVVSGGPLAEAAEAVGLIHMLDRRVLDLALAYLAERRDERIAVNVSAATTGDTTWFDALSAWLGLRPDLAPRLMVEITETAAIADITVTARFVADLRALGVRVAIDDFGTGHTSFKALKELAIDLVKIDGSFVRDMATSRDSEAFVRALLALSRELGFETVAEQVETEAEAAMLEALGADYLQGDLLAPAALVEEVEQPTEASASKQD
jgi:diguanylate cyclase (GGDEF)-like protein